MTMIESEHVVLITTLLESYCDADPFDSLDADPFDSLLGAAKSKT